MSGAPLASQPTISRFENGARRTVLYRMGRELAACVIERHRRRLHGRARRITIDLDPTDDLTHGAQQLTFFNGHYGGWCYLPLLGFLSFDREAEQLALGAVVVVVVLRAHTAPAEEARRVALFSTGFLMCTGLSALYHVLELFSPGSLLSNFRWSPVLLAAEPLRFPGVALLWCSVLAVRVPHLREAVRAAYQQMLARRGLLAGAAAIPAVALAGLVASRPDRTVGSMVADPLVQSLAAVAGVLLLVSAKRERLLMRLDAWIYPETADQRQALADAAAALGKAERIETVSRTLSRTAERGCGSPVALLLPADAAAADLNAPDGKVAPLARASAIVHVLEAGDRSLRVHPNDKTSIFGLLPCDDRRWVAETDADVILGVPGPGAELLGVLAAGRRFDGRIVRSVDIPFLEVLGAAAGLAVGRLMRAGEAGALDEPPAQECPVCRCLTRTGESPACDCGSEYVETEAPTLLAGKYRLTRRLGTGWTGAAFLARDLRLERDVAVKTLTGVSVLRLMGLKPEAWAMATVNHPAIAHVYGIESWRNRPFLAVEFLPGGTLADRLRRGPVGGSPGVRPRTRSPRRTTPEPCPRPSSRLARREAERAAAPDRSSAGVRGAVESRRGNWDRTRRMW